MTMVKLDRIAKVLQESADRRGMLCIYMSVLLGFALLAGRCTPMPTPTAGPTTQVVCTPAPYATALPLSFKDVSWDDRRIAAVVTPTPTRFFVYLPVVMRDIWAGSPPAAIEGEPGKPFSLSGEWTWLCAGDFSVTRHSDGEPVVLYDSDPQTGLILVLPPTTTTTTITAASGTWGGHCEAFAPQAPEINTRKRDFIDWALFDVDVCPGGCQSVYVEELSLSPGGTTWSESCYGRFGPCPTLTPTPTPSP